MIFDDSSPVRYLMKEMDPSEELLCEKKMLEDEDLLIEVESLRKVCRRLSDLPVKNPPPHLTRKILLEASDHYHQKERARSRMVFLYASAAATVLIMFFAGAFWVLEDPTRLLPGSETIRASMGGPATPSGQTPPAPAVHLPVESPSTDPTPWVDMNQELHFTDRFSAENAAQFDSILHHSLQRLQPVQTVRMRNESPGSGSHRSGRAPGLHLTGQH